MKPGTWNFIKVSDDEDYSIRRGVRLTFAAEINTVTNRGEENEESVPFDFTGYDIQVLFVDSVTQEAADLTVELGDGVQIIGDDNNKVHMTLTPSETAILTGNLYLWQMDIIDEDGNRDRLFEGVATPKGYA
jgi:hypothetical protein